MSNFSRRLALRRQAESSKVVARQVAAQARAGQVARSSVPIGDADVDLTGGIELGQDVAVQVDYHDGALSDSDDLTGGVLDALPGIAEDIVWSDAAAGSAGETADGVWESADDLAVEESFTADEAARAGADSADVEVQVADAVVAVEAAQAAAAQAAADALDAAAASAAASQAAADAKLEAEAATSAAAQAAQDATDKSAAAEAAAKAYAEAQAAAAEAAAVAEASGDASAKADAARLAAEAAAALDASAKAAAAEAAAKADAAAAQATADAAKTAAENAQGAADSARFLAEGLYQAIPSVAAPTASPSGPLKQGDMWFVIGAPGTDVAGKFVGVQVWDGVQWMPRQLVGNSVLVPGSVGNVLIEDGGVTAAKVAADFYYGREFFGGSFTGGEFVMYDLPAAATQVLTTSLVGWSGAGATLVQVGQSIRVTLSGTTGGARYTFPTPLAPPVAGSTIEVDGLTAGEYLLLGRTNGVLVGSSISGGKAVFSAADVTTEVIEMRVYLGAHESPALLTGPISITYVPAGGAGIKLRRDASGSAILESGSAGAGIRILGRTIGGSDGVSEVELSTRTIMPGNTFALKSQMDAWVPIDGTHAWVTSEGREYVRAGGQWRALADIAKDRDWFNIPLQSGFSFGASGFARAKIVQGVFYLSVYQVQRTSGTGNANMLDFSQWCVPGADLVYPLGDASANNQIQAVITAQGWLRANWNNGTLYRGAFPGTPV